MSEEKEKFADLGLGSKATAGSYRALNKDGSFNTRKINIPFFERIIFFHTLISMSWFRFICLIIAGYSSVNLIFAAIYMRIGVENLTGVVRSSAKDNFLEAFFFSAQTITTLGYGRVAPIGALANSVAAVESMLGLLGFALATGLLYGRFSKPSGKIKYSSIAVIAPFHDINGFMFRVVNPHSNQLIEVEATVTCSMKREQSELRDFHILELERPQVVFLPSVWTIVHPIDKSSPLFGMTEQDFIEKDVEFIIMLRAFDESFSQTVYSRSSYKPSEISWGRKFVYLIRHENETTIADIGRLDETEVAVLNIQTDSTQPAAVSG